MKLLKTYAACTALAILTACGSNKKISYNTSNSSAAGKSAVTQENVTADASAETSVNGIASEYTEPASKAAISFICTINGCITIPRIMTASHMSSPISFRPTGTRSTWRTAVI